MVVLDGKELRQVGLTLVEQILAWLGGILPVHGFSAAVPLLLQKLVLAQVLGELVGLTGRLQLHIVLRVD